MTAEATPGGLEAAARDTADWAGLRASALAAARAAYAPYSRLHVGAAALTDLGRLVTGCNVENASYGLTLCAECGLVSALHAGGGGRLVALSVVAGDGEPLAPCGRCRQLLMEHGGPSLLVDAGPGAPPRRLGELLPDSFGAPDLAARREGGRTTGGGVTGSAGSPARVEPFDAVDVIRGKRDGRELADDELRWVVDAFTRGVVAPEQMSALLMAVVFRGMTARELTAWADAMLRSGERLDLSGVGRPTVDKHSTGGVGDKVSLCLAPLVAACGAAMPQLSGRGLGHTGGTLDKMEAIPGWRAALPVDDVRAVLADVGAVICAAGPGLAPADRELYALRDVTGTVESVPLIASSIMSKKIAEGTSALVLDVKVGSGAFLPSVESARELATTMVGLGEAYGVRTSALLTSMETPLGLACGNGLEVAEAVEVLGGGGPADVVEVTVALAREMLALVGAGGPDPADVLAAGAALPVWEAMVRAQGGDPAAPLPRAAHVEPVRAHSGGVLQRLDARAVGVAAWRLGAGRSRRDEAVSPAAGVLLRAKPGDAVRPGDVLLELHTDEPARLDRALAALEGAWETGADPVPRSPLVLERIGAADA